MKYHRTNSDFLTAKKIGQAAEREFMDIIALMGGTASALGTVPTMGDQTPRFSRPHPNVEDGFCYSVSPDILFTLPNEQRGQANLAQVKVKKLQSEANKGFLFVYLDESELHRMNIAAKFYNVYFVINVPNLENVENYDSWLWLNIDEIHESKIKLLKRRISQKPTFLIPLKLFKPISNLASATTDVADKFNFPTYY